MYYDYVMYVSLSLSIDLIPVLVINWIEPVLSSWTTDEWGKCSASCEGGHRRRKVYCAEMVNSTLIQVGLLYQHSSDVKYSAQRNCFRSTNAIHFRDHPVDKVQLEMDTTFRHSLEAFHFSAK